MYKLINDMLPNAMNSLIVINNYIQQYNAENTEPFSAWFTSRMQTSCK